MDANKLVFYHGDCPDGMTAAWAVWKALGAKDVAYVPAYYGEPLSADVAGRSVVFVDFCPKPHQLPDIRLAAKDVLILDHHKSAAKDMDLSITPQVPQAEVRGPGFHALFDLRRSGAGMAWDYYHPGAQAPLLVEYAQDRDLWLHKLPYTHELAAVMRSYPLTLQDWDALAGRFSFVEQDDRCLHDYDPLVIEGRSILRYQHKLIDELVAQAVPVELGGHKVKATMSPLDLRSETAGRLAEGQAFGVTWCMRKNNLYQFSLRVRDGSKGGVDVSEVARLYGGGGHANAAGFEVTADRVIFDRDLRDLTVLPLDPREASRPSYTDLEARVRWLESQLEAA